MLFQLVLKDFKRMIRDYKGLAIIILMPAVLMAVLGFSIGGIFSDEESFTPANIAIVDKDNSEQGYAEVEKFFHSPTISKNISADDILKLNKAIKDLDLKKILYQDVLESEKVKQVIRYKMMPEPDAMKLLKEGKLSAVIVIPEDFTYNMLFSLFTPFKNHADIEIIKNPNKFSSGIVESILKAYSDALSAVVIAKDSYLEAAIWTGAGAKSYRNLENMAEKLYGQGIKDVNIKYMVEPGKKPISGFQYYSAGMATMFILFTAAFGGHFLIDEKKKYTYHRMLLAGITRNQMLVSRLISTSMITVVQITLLMLLSRAMFRASWGNIADFFAFTVVVAFATGGLAVMLSAMNLRANSEKFSEIMNMGVSQFLAFLGGNMFPLFGIPFLNSLSRFVPNGAALNGYLNLMKGYSFYEIGSNILTLIILGLLFSTLGFSVARGGAE
ncbi:MAG: linearmycin/streptolysin transport system permease protein [Thermoanaerobacteraceae bacterium]|nr:linearmycin/streptolysin transport system permease protein [Thermoanaerobacteraceae bacterium]